MRRAAMSAMNTSERDRVRPVPAQSSEEKVGIATVSDGFRVPRPEVGRCTPTPRLRLPPGSGRPHRPGMLRDQQNWPCVPAPYKRRMVEPCGVGAAPAGRETFWEAMMRWLVGFLVAALFGAMLEDEDKERQLRLLRAEVMRDEILGYDEELILLAGQRAVRQNGEIVEGPCRFKAPAAPGENILVEIEPGYVVSYRWPPRTTVRR